MGGNAGCWGRATLIALTGSSLCLALLVGGAWVWVAAAFAGLLGPALLLGLDSSRTSGRPIAELNGGSGEFVVSLREVGARRIYVMRVVRQFTGLDGDETRNVLSSLPREFCLRTAEDAQAMVAALQREGAVASIR
jgi:hypothetical protein